MTLLRNLSRMFPSLLKEQPPEKPWKAEADKVRLLAAPCPVCESNDLAGHRYALFASQLAVVATEELKRFCALFHAHRWQELNQIRKFDGRWNAALMYVVFCHHGGYMMIVRDPVELYDASNVIEIARFDDEEADNIRSLQVELHEL